MKRLLIAICASIIICGVPIAAAAETLTLNEALQIARQNNPQFKISQTEVDIAEGGLDRARAYPNPDLDFFAGVQQLDDGAAGGALSGSVIGGEISQEIELWGKRGLRKQIATEDIHIAKQRRGMTWQEMALIVKEQFYRLLLETQLLQIAQDNLAIGKQFLGSTELKFQQNEVPYSDVLRARLEVVRLRSDVLDREADLEIGKHALNTLLGREPETAFQASGALQFSPLRNSLEDLVTRALETRPELDLARSQIEQAQQSFRLAKRRRLPNPSLKFWGEKEGEETKYGGGIGFELPLWYRQKGEIRETQGLKLRSEIEQSALSLQIERETRDAYRELKKIDQDLAVRKEGIEASAELIRTSFQSYQEGRTSFLKFLETMRTVNEFKIDYYTTLALWHRQRAVLEKAIGSDL